MPEFSILSFLWKFKSVFIIIAMGLLIIHLSDRVDLKTAEAAKASSDLIIREKELNELQAVAKVKDEAVNASIERERVLTDENNKLVQELLSAPTVEDDVVAPIGKRAFDGMRRIEGSPAAAAKRKHS